MIDLDKLAGKDSAELRAIRISMSKEFRPEPAQKVGLLELLKRLLMLYNAQAPKDIAHTHPGWSCFMKPDVRPVIRALGESAYKIAGMGGLYRLCDMFNTVQVKTLGSEDHASVRELNLIWHGIGDTSGEPIKDYWLS
jgi:hypothetical protein